MRIRLFGLAAALSASALAAACGGSTDAPVATTIDVSPTGAQTIVSLNGTRQLTAAVLDQSGDSMTGQVITWSSSAATVAFVSGTGLVTGLANGTATITATSGGAHTDVAFTVAQVASAMTKTGDAQTGTAGVALGAAIGVHVVDAGGSAVAGVVIAFTPTAGSGSVTPTATTNATGDATATWTLGTVAGTGHQVNATVGALTANFTATANVGVAAAAVIQAGNNQTRVSGLAVPIAPSVRINDAFGNARAGATVLFTVTGGGGSVTGGTQVTNASGIATVGSWTMGVAAGPNTLQAAVQGTAVAVSFAATAVSAGSPTLMTITLGNNQTALAGYPTNIRPAVVVTDAGGQPVSGVSVTFAAATGGGSVTTATVNTNVVGMAQVDRWTVGAAAGPNTLTATAAPGGITGNPATINATAAAPTYNVTIQNIGPAFSAPVQAAFDSAVAFWQRTIYGDVADIANFTTSAGQCSSPAVIGPVNVDDVLIIARIDSIDGPGQVLGSAGPCFVRTTGRLTIAGSMRFDSADITGLVNGGSLNAVIRHEMGHVLGFGTLWTQAAFNCLQNASATGNVLDTYFSCPRAQSAFDSIGGTSYTGGNKVPVENCGPASPAGCGAGTVNSHWREPTFFNEMMTGYLNGGGPNPASLLTIAAMEDLGYVVNYGAAETYTRVFTAPSLLQAAAGTRIHLRNDIYTGPIYEMDLAGRVVGVFSGPRP